MQIFGGRIELGVFWNDSHPNQHSSSYPWGLKDLFLDVLSTQAKVNATKNMGKLPVEYEEEVYGEDQAQEVEQEEDVYGYRLEWKIYSFLSDRSHIFAV